MAVVIDSSVCIALERRGAGPDDVLTLVPDEPVALAAVSASELRFGVSGGREENASLRLCSPSFRCYRSGLLRRVSMHACGPGWRRLGRSSVHTIS